MNYIEYDESDIQSFEYETTMVSDGNIIGTCELGKAEIQMLNNSNEYSSLKESWIETVHGSFYIYDVAPVQERVNIKLSCYDIKYKLDKPYDSSKHTFPCKLKEWRNSIFNDCEVIYDDSDFPNSELLLEEEPYVENGASNRQVIQMIAQAGASAVVTDENDCFYFKWFEDVIHTVEDWTELTTEKEASKPVNTIVLGRGSTEDNIYYPEEELSEKVEFRIDNNYILDPQDVTSTEDRRYQTIIPVYDQINRFSYLIFSMRTQNIENKLSVKLGQKIRYLDIYDNELEAYVMTKKIIYLGGSMLDDNNYEITLSAEKINETSTDLSYSSSVINDILRVERKTDKNKGVIEDVIEKQSEHQKQIVKISQTVDTIQQQVSGEYGMDREVMGTNQVFIEDAMKYHPIELRISGYSKPQYLLYPNFMPGIDVVPLKYEEEMLTTLTVCVDSQDRQHPTENLQEYPIEIKEPLRAIGAVKDELYVLIEDGELKAYIIRYFQYTGEQIVKLDKPTTETITCPKIELLEHTNYVYIKEKLNYQMYIKYLVYSKFNDFYATKVQMNTTIKQTENSIMQEVSQKADDNEIKTLLKTTAGNFEIELSKKTKSSNIIATINASPENLQILFNKIGIQANDVLNLLAGNEINMAARNISLKSDNCSIDKNGNAKFKNGEFEGKLKSTDGEIAGWTINGNGLTNGTVFLHSDGSSTIYTVADLIVMRGYIMGTQGFEMSAAMIQHYDLNGDGVVNSTDFVTLQNLIGISM